MCSHSGVTNGLLYFGTTVWGISKYLASIRSLNTKNTLKQFFENHFNLAIRRLRILVHGDLNVVDGVPLCAVEAI